MWEATHSGVKLCSHQAKANVKVNIFFDVSTPVCDSVHGGTGVSVPLHTRIHTPLGRHPTLGTPPPREITPPRYYGIRSTAVRILLEMHTCFFKIFFACPLIFFSFTPAFARLLKCNVIGQYEVHTVHVDMTKQR